MDDARPASLEPNGDEVSWEEVYAWLKSDAPLSVYGFVQERYAEMRSGTLSGLREEVGLLREMVALLTKAESASLGFLAAHGWYTDPELVRRGQEIRARLAALAPREDERA